MIREYQSADCEGVLDVWARASAVAHPFLSEEFQAQERHNIPNMYLPNAETWVWEADGRVVGFISLLGNEIGGLFVDPGFHRTGIGRALVGRAIDLRGELEVEVFEKNWLGRVFYASLGFDRMDQKVHPGTGFDVLRLRLPATQPHPSIGE